MIYLIDLVALLGPSREPQTAAQLLGTVAALAELTPYFRILEGRESFDHPLRVVSVEAARVAVDEEALRARGAPGGPYHPSRRWTCPARQSAAHGPRKEAGRPVLCPWPFAPTAGCRDAHYPRA